MRRAREVRGSTPESAAVVGGVGGSCWGPPFIGRRSVWRSGGGLGGAHVSAGVAFGALEDSSEGLDLCEDEELSLGRVLAYDCL